MPKNTSKSVNIVKWKSYANTISFKSSNHRLNINPYMNKRERDSQIPTNLYKFCPQNFRREWGTFFESPLPIPM